MSYIGKQPRKAALTSSDIEDGIITAAKIEDGAVVAAEIASNAVTTAKINADAVTGAKIADDAINSEHYTNGSIDTAHIAADQIVGSLIADNAIDSEHYTDGSIDTAHIAADQITNAKIADDQIDSEHYVDGSIDTAHIADVNVTQGKIADQAINEAKMQISNGPTNGYFLSAQSGNTGGLTWAEAGGEWVRTHYTQIGNAGATQIDFTGLSSSYKLYKFYFNNIRPESDDVYMKFFMNVNGSFQTSDYGYAIAIIDTDDTHNSAAAPEDNAFARVQVNGTGNATGETLNGEITIFDPSGTTNKNVITTHFNSINSGGKSSSNVGVISNMSSAAALTGIRIKFSSGKMLAGGLIIGYGLKA